MEKNLDYNLTQEDFSPLPKNSFTGEEIVREPTTYIKDVWRNFKKRPSAVISFFILLAIILLVLVGPMLLGYNYYSNDYSCVNEPPSAAHWFGTDTLGRDLWTRVWYGGRVSLFIAIAATIIPFIIGMLIGGVSGYFGGKLDMIIMRAIDVFSSIPTMIYTILLMVVVGRGNVMTLVVAFTITRWLGAARLTRGLVLQLKTREFCMASKTLGASPARIICKHLLPNTLGIAVVNMTASVPEVIFAEAFLSFIGLGVTPPRPSWGQLIKNAAEVFRTYPYQFLCVGVVVSVTILCFNLMGDGLRDALDPRLHTS